MADTRDERLRALAERVRAACLAAAEAAYEDAGLQGLCADGRWECARQAISGVDLEREIAHSLAVSDPQQRTPSRSVT
jgi:hypothetical protein